MAVDFNQLKNTYFALRHAHSVANEKEIVLSLPENGIQPKWGLSDLGRRQCQEKFTAGLLNSLGIEANQVVCYSSDFSRALETAEIFCQRFSLAGPIITLNLRERFFGDLEKTATSGYDLIWQKDAEDAGHHHFHCESSIEVGQRIKKLVEEVETNQSGKTIIFVSHGDTLQICQTIFKGLNPGEHRSQKHLENAELRLLN